MAIAAKQDVPYDPTIYPTEDHMGEGSLQRFISELFRALAERWLRGLGHPTFVGANQFIYWKQFDPKRSLAPDVFVLPGVEPGIKIDSWKIWERGITPSFALEIVSQDEYLKDYRDGPPSYDEIGVQELIIFDPEHQKDPAERLRFQVFRRLPKRGLVRVEATNEARVRSRVLGCHVRAVGAELNTLRLRLATGPKGDALFPTAEEAELAAREGERAAQDVARAALEAERAAREGERAAQDVANVERAAREEAEAELVQLRAEIALLRGKTRT
ncbi:MAG: Uma2 family endonuclease [Byssovorax sp.]